MSPEHLHLKYDVSHITSADVEPLEAKLADISRRRSLIATATEEASASLAKAQQQLADISAGMAIGKPSAPSVTTAARAAAHEAEAHAEVAWKASKILEAEHEEVGYQLYVANRHRAMELYRQQVAAERLVAAALDQAAAAFNAAYDRWKDARVKSASMFPTHNGMGGFNPFPNGGAGLMGSISLHPEVAVSLARLGFAPPERGKVVNFTAALG